MLRVLVLLLVLAPSLAWPATYWASPSGGALNCAAASGDTDPGVYRTRIQVIDCLASGDTAMLKDGTYTEACTDVFCGWGNTPAGLSATHTRLLCESPQGCIIMPSSGVSGSGIGVRGRQYIDIGDVAHGFVVDMSNVAISFTRCVNGIRLYDTGMTANTNGGRVFGNRVRGHNCQGLSNNSGLPGIMWVGVEFAYNVVERPRTPLSGSNPVASGSASHAAYVTGLRTYMHHNSLYIYNADGGDYSYGMVCYGKCQQDIWEDNKVFVEGHAAGSVAGGGTGQDDHTFRNNTYVRVGTPPPANNVCIDTIASGDQVKAYNNTCHGFTILIDNLVGSIGNELKNNVCVGVTCTINDPGGTLTTATNVLNAPSSHFRDIGTNDYSLTDLATTLINQGTNVGLPFNGTAPDIGAHETFPPSSAKIDGTVITIAFEMNGPQLINPFSSSGWTAACSGTGCGTPTVTNVTPKPGTTNMLDITLSGITGGACALGQTWTISYSSTTGNVQDNAMIGGDMNQYLLSLPSYAVANTCGGGGPPPPTSPDLTYEFEGNALDMSGNANHGTAVGISYVSGKFGQGAKTDNALNEYVEMPFGSGYDPSATSKTLASWVYVDPSDTGTTKSVAGTIVGTNQRMHIFRQAGNWRLGIGSNAGGTPTEFSVSPGWTHVCVSLNAATHTATLHINGAAGTSSGAAVQTYSSFTLAGNIRIGLANGNSAANGGSHIYERVKLWPAVVSCTDEYNAGNSSSGTWTGNYAVVGSQGFLSKLCDNIALDPSAAINSQVTITPDGSTAVAFQLDCSVTNCSAISTKLYYKCPLCPSGNTEIAVGNAVTSDKLTFYKDTDQGLLSGAHGSTLNGSSRPLLHEATHTTESSTKTITLTTAQSTIQRYIVKCNGCTPGWVFNLYLKEGGGADLNGHTPAGGLPIKVVEASAQTGH